MKLFAFLIPEWPTVHEAAEQAAAAARSDPRTACFHARRALELAVAWAFKYDPALKLPYQDNLSALIHEIVRLRLRDLIQLIEKHRRKLVYTNFEDVMGAETEIGLTAFGELASFAKFLAKARAFLNAHQDHITVHKLRMSRVLTESDLAELERMLVESGVGGTEEIDRAKIESHGLGLFVRSLIGLDREAAKEALGGFLTGKTLGANQIEFVNLIVDHLTDHGMMEAARLYESPFTDLSPRGPEEIFSSEQVEELVATLDQVRRTAIAA